jgi:hypothetical protein
MKQMWALVPALQNAKDLIKRMEEAKTESRRIRRSTTIRACPPGAQYIQ